MKRILLSVSIAILIIISMGFILAECIDSDGGKNYNVKGNLYTCSVSNSSGGTSAGCTVPVEDQCLNSTIGTLMEYYCSNSTKNYVLYDCPNGCKDGACIESSCVGEGKSYGTGPYPPNSNITVAKCCEGLTAVSVSQVGENGVCITQTDSAMCTKCGNGVCGLGENKCNCPKDCPSNTTTTPVECKSDSDCPSACSMCGSPGGSNYESCIKKCINYKCVNGACVANKGCQPTKCDDGTMTECKESNGVCSCSTCPPIIIKPVCGNGICESGEGEICVTTAIAISCAEGKECKIPPPNCFVVCPQDCKPIDPINVNINEKFKLQVYQPAKINENNKDVLKVTFKDLIAYECKEAELNVTESQVIEAKVASVTGNIVSETATSPISVLKCNGTGPKALLEIETINDGKLGNNNIINLDVGEKKQVGDFTIYFSGYDYASRTGTFLVSRETFTCPVGCKCDDSGKTIICSNKTCGDSETMCPDGTCKDKCDIINPGDCKYGCMYEGKCFPMGVRSKGNYCSDNLVMGPQKKSDEICENNFECSSNVCVSGKCISEGLMDKIINWFKSIFGGK